MSKVDTVRAMFESYRTQNREAADRLLADEFVFTSPQDDHIDKRAFFERCFPTADRFVSHGMLHVVPTEGDDVFVMYEYQLKTGERQFGRATIIGVEDAADGGVDLSALMRVLRERQCARVFVEGGGVTVSLFLAAHLLTRLHVAIAPLLIGDGRPAIRLAGRAALGDCHRPRYRVFRMGGDILFDCDLASGDANGSSEADREPAVTRVI